MKDKEKQINRTDNFGELSDTVSIPNKEKTITVSKFEDIKLTIPCKKEIEEKQITEMAKTMRLHICKDRPCKECDCHGLGDKTSVLYHCDCYYYAKSLVKQGYRKILENAFILSKAEKEKLLKGMYEQGKFDALADLEKDGKVVLSKEEYEKLKQFEHMIGNKRRAKNEVNTIEYKA